MTTETLSTLPVETLLQIFDYVPALTLYNLSCTNRRFRALIGPLCTLLATLRDRDSRIDLLLSLEALRADRDSIYLLCTRCEAVKPFYHFLHSVYSHHNGPTRARKRTCIACTPNLQDRFEGRWILGCTIHVNLKARGFVLSGVVKQRTIYRVVLDTPQNTVLVPVRMSDKCRSVTELVRRLDSVGLSRKELVELRWKGTGVPGPNPVADYVAALEKGLNERLRAERKKQIQMEREKEKEGETKGENRGDEGFDLWTSWTGERN